MGNVCTNPDNNYDGHRTRNTEGLMDDLKLNNNTVSRAEFNTAQEEVVLIGIQKANLEQKLDEIQQRYNKISSNNISDDILNNIGLCLNKLVSIDVNINGNGGSNTSMDNFDDFDVNAFCQLNDDSCLSGNDVKNVRKILNSFKESHVGKIIKNVHNNNMDKNIARKLIIIMLFISSYSTKTNEVCKYIVRIYLNAINICCVVDMGIRYNM